MSKPKLKANINNENVNVPVTAAASVDNTPPPDAEEAVPLTPALSNPDTEPLPQHASPSADPAAAASFLSETSSRTSQDLPAASLHTCIVWNVDGDSGISSESRRKDMEHVLQNIEELNDSMIFFCQDKINGPKAGIFHKKNFPGPYIADAGIFVRNGRPFNSSILTRMEDKIKTPNPHFTISRLRACSLDAVGLKRLLVSWHGPSKISEEDKIGCFITLIHFVELLRIETTSSVVILGGDFNFDASQAEIILQKWDSQDLSKGINGCVLYDYEAQLPRDRINENETYNIWDYLVVWPQDLVRQTQRPTILCKDYKRKKGQRPFDHPIVQYHLEILSTQPEADTSKQTPAAQAPLQNPSAESGRQKEGSHALRQTATRSSPLQRAAQTIPPDQAAEASGGASPAQPESETVSQPPPSDRGRRRRQPPTVTHQQTVGPKTPALTSSTLTESAPTRPDNAPLEPDVITGLPTPPQSPQSEQEFQDDDDENDDSALHHSEANSH